MNLITFPTPKTENTDAIAMLERWIEEVRSGKIIAVAVAGLNSEKCTCTSYAGAPADLIGAACILKHRLTLAMYD